MSSFDFLKRDWGVELKPEAQQELQDHAESLKPPAIKDYIKDCDIRKFGVISSLPKDLARSKSTPPGQYLAQVTKIVDITQPCRFQEDFEGGKWRLLLIDLTDGDQKFKAIEYASTPALGVHLPPGTKLLLWSTKEAPLAIVNTQLLLTADNVEVLGGNVEKLCESWRASKEVESNRLLWRTEGIKKTDKEDAAPPWVDFDPKKAPRVGSNTFDKERAEWRNATGATVSAVGTLQSCKESNARFDKQAFATEDCSGQPKSQVSSNAFVQADKGKGKGKKGKECGGGKGRRGRGDWDDDGGEEKRAPLVGNTLAAFIKPTKKGEKPEEALAAFADPVPSKKEQADWDGGWDEGTAWTADDWGGNSWGDSGGGWSSGSWGGRGGKGGKGSKKGGKGKGKGNRKGGGKQSGGGTSWYS